MDELKDGDYLENCRRAKHLLPKGWRFLGLGELVPVEEDGVVVRHINVNNYLEDANFGRFEVGIGGYRSADAHTGGHYDLPIMVPMPANPYRTVKLFEKTSLEDSIRAINDVLISDITDDLRPLLKAFDWSSTPQGVDYWDNIRRYKTELTQDDKKFLEFLRADFNDRIKEALPDGTKIVSDEDILATGLLKRIGSVGETRLFLSRSLLKVALGYGIGGTARRKLVELDLIVTDFRGREENVSDKGSRWLWELYGSI